MNRPNMGPAANKKISRSSERQTSSTETLKSFHGDAGAVRIGRQVGSLTPHQEPASARNLIPHDDGNCLRFFNSRHLRHADPMILRHAHDDDEVIHCKTSIKDPPPSSPSPRNVRTSLYKQPLLRPTTYQSPTPPSPP